MMCDWSAFTDEGMEWSDDSSSSLDSSSSPTPVVPPTPAARRAFARRQGLLVRKEAVATGTACAPNSSFPPAPSVTICDATTDGQLGSSCPILLPDSQAALQQPVACAPNFAILRSPIVECDVAKLPYVTVFDHCCWEYLHNYEHRPLVKHASSLSFVD